MINILQTILMTIFTLIVITLILLIEWYYSTLDKGNRYKAKKIERWMLIMTFFEFLVIIFLLVI